MKPDSEKQVATASIKVMLSYDYCHFEVVLGIQDASLKEVNELGKDAQRLADERVRQYKKTKAVVERRYLRCNEEELRADVARVREKPESEWDDYDKAVVRKLADYDYWKDREYDYDDDWSEAE